MEKIKVLIYCYDYPPLKTVGAIRPHAWAKYFHEFGIQPTVLTRKWQANILTIEDTFKSDPKGIQIEQTPELTTIKIPYSARFKDRVTNMPLIGKYLRKSLTFFEIFFKWNSTSLDEKAFLKKELDRLVSKERFDLIIVSGEPFILFKHAYEIGIKHGIPYILDYRDGWSFNELRKQQTNNLLLKLLQKVENKSESLAIENSLFYVTVYDKILKYYEAGFPNIKGHIIENGIDLNLLEQAAELKNPFSEEKFTILYTGIFYPGHNVELFLNVINRLIHEYPEIKKRLRCVFVGINQRPNANSKLVDQAVNSTPENFDVIAPIPHIDALNHQLNAHLLLKFSAKSQLEVGNGAKLYEYAATKNPILTVLSVNDKRTSFYPGQNVQALCVTEAEIEDCILTNFNAWKAGESIQTDLSDEDIFKMSRKFQTGQLAELIKQNLAQETKV